METFETNEFAISIKVRNGLAVYTYKMVVG